MQLVLNVKAGVRRVLLVKVSIALPVHLHLEIRVTLLLLVATVLRLSPMASLHRLRRTDLVPV